MKNLKFGYLLLIAFSTTVIAFAQPKGYKKSADGLVYKIHSDKEGPAIKKGDIVTLHFIMKTDKDSIFQNSFKDGKPVVMKLSDGQYKGSLEDGMVLLSKGDSATFLVSSDSLFGQQLPPFIKKGSNTGFIIKIISAVSEDEYKKEQDRIAKETIAKEDKTLQEYLTKNNLKATKTASGLYYVQTQAGTGAKAENGKTVSVHYTGKLLNGTKFDSSVDRGTPFEFTLGQGQVIRGWDEGIALMSIGEKGTLVIPSGLGYGERGAGASIPPNSILIFDVELLGVK